MVYRASFVIPAHNEEFRIRSLLDTVSKMASRGEYAVFVVCNGCSDRTHEVTSEYPGIIAFEIEDVGKHFALNAGDERAGDIYPRLYCDADIDIDADSVERIIEVLTSDEVVVAGPKVRFDVSRSSRSVANYYRALDSSIVSKWSDSHLSGRGLYAASRKARHRFGAFPSLLADDAYFEEQFDSSEKRFLADANLTLPAPKTFRELLRSEARVVTGNRQFGSFLTTAQTKNVAPPATMSVMQLLLRKSRTLKQWTKEFQLRDFMPLCTYVTVKIVSRVIVRMHKVRGRTASWR